MGDSCCKTEADIVVVNTEVNFPQWKDAVENHHLVAMKIMHSNDPDLINEPIDTVGSRAIHLAVKTRNSELLAYVLDNGADVNVRGGLLQNTALHEAVILEDIQAVRDLFSFSVDDNITNINKKTAFKLCSNDFKRHYMKAKHFRNKNSEKYERRREERDMNEREDIRVAGMNISNTSRAMLKKYNTETNETDNYYRKKYLEIQGREVTVTRFGDQIGVDVDEIALVLQKIDNKKIAWDKMAKMPVLTKKTQIYKVLYSLTVSAMRKKHKSKRPKLKPMRDLTTRLCKKLPKKRGKACLTEDIFTLDVQNYLYEIHEEMIEEEALDDSEST